MNEQTDIVVGKKIAQKTIQGILPNTYWKKHYSLYSFSLGAGNKPRYLVIEPHNEIKQGDTTLCLKQETNKELIALPESKKDLEQMCKEQEIPLQKFSKKSKSMVEKRKEELIEDLFKIHKTKRPLFFKKTIPIEKEEIEKLTNEEMNQIINNYLYNGKKDEKIVLMFKSSLIQPTFETIQDPKRFMPYNDHQILFTNHKTGKSTLAEKVGLRPDEMTTANLLGFATANDIHRGELHNQTRPTSLDETQEQKEDELFGKLFNLLELGIATIGKGIALIKLETLSSFRFLGNPRGIDENQTDSFTDQLERNLLLYSFEDTIRKISSNTSALSSRIGTTLYSSTIQTAEGKPLTIEETEENIAYVTSLTELLKKPFSKLFEKPPIIDWLNTPFDKQHEELINLILKDITSDSDVKIRVKNYIKGHLNAYRHLRGQALKLAVLEKPISFLKNKMSMKQLIEIAEEKTEDLKQINLESFKEMRDSFSEEFEQKYREKVYSNLPQHLKLLITAVSQYQKKKELPTPIAIMKPELEDQITETRKDLELPKMSVNTVFERTYKQLNKNNELLKNFNMCLIRIDGVEAIELASEPPKNLEITEESV